MGTSDWSLSRRQPFTVRGGQEHGGDTQDTDTRQHDPRVLARIRRVRVPDVSRKAEKTQATQVHRDGEET